MRGMKAYVIVTTINVPKFLNGFADNFERFGHKEDVGFIVIGDRKTPRQTGQVLNNLAGRGFDARYFDIAAQDDWVARFPELKRIIPYDSDNRRNIGYLIGVELGAEKLFIIDDDNWISEGDYYTAHSIVGEYHSLPTIDSSLGWFNPCTLLEMDPPRLLYPRGFPYSKRWQSAESKIEVTEGRIVLNAGLWLREPDVDAITRLNEPVRSVRLLKERVMLRPGVWAPINTQNTAVHRDIVPCSYYIRMGAQLDGLTIDRFGDIWFGFFAKKVIDHMGDRVTFGVPATDHRRNVHNLLSDLKQELAGIILTDFLVGMLEEIKMTASTYAESYLELADGLDSLTARSGKGRQVKEYFKQITHGMRVWVDVVRQIMAL